MNTFEEYQAVASKVPVSLRNDRGRVELPVRGLQEEAGKIGSLLRRAFGSGRIVLTQEQSSELKDRLSDALWYLTRICSETGIALNDLAVHSVAQFESRTKGLDPNQR